jgi:DNA polymerase II large subunit
VADQPPIEGARTTATTASLRSPLANKLRAPSTASKPPNLRQASTTAISCSHCKYYKRLDIGKGACRKYGGYRVRDTQVSDSFAH